MKFEILEKQKNDIKYNKRKVFNASFCCFVWSYKWDKTIQKVF